MTDQTRARRLDKARQQLGVLPELALIASLHLTPTNQPTDDNRVKASSNPSRPPLNLDIVQLLDRRLNKLGADNPGERDTWLDRAHFRWEDGQKRMTSTTGYRLGVLGTLWCWVSLIVAEREDQHDVSDAPDETNATWTDICRWLAKYADWIIANHPDFPADINRMHEALRTAAREPARKPWPCPDCKWETEPQGDPDDDGRYALHVCRGCGHVWRLKELEDQLDSRELAALKAAENAVTLAYAARQVGRSVSTLKEWVQAGKLDSLGFDRQRNAALYPLDHIRRLSSAQPSRKRASRESA